MLEQEKKVRLGWRMLLVVPVFLAFFAVLGGDAAEDEAVVEEGGLPPGLEYPKWETTAPGQYADYNQRTNLLQRGYLVYQKYCVGCHGEYGDGQGPAATRLITQPRDFTSGIYKFRSTDSGSLPLESDIERTLVRGLSRVSMPAFPLMPARERLAVVEYIKSFYPRWEDEKDRRRVVPIPHPPADLGASERARRGRMVYLQMQCSKCHGIDGRGTGATQTEYVDAWGNTQKPFDFTRGSLKGGNAPQDIYRTFHTGLRSIMPAYEGDTLAAVTADGFAGVSGGLEAEEITRLEGVLGEYPATAAEVFGEMSEGERLELAQRNSWDLVAYVISLRNRTSTAAAVLGAGEPAAGETTDG
jgi:cytochrome c oxidase cbb3-type subunit 2